MSANLARYSRILSGLSLMDEVNQIGRADSNTVFMARQLEFLETQTYDVLRPLLESQELIPTNPTNTPGANEITYRQYDKTGVAKIISNFADDLPRADVSAKEFTAKVRTIGQAYGYSVIELQNAIMANTPLETLKMEAAMRAIDEELDRIAFFGDAENGLQGWLSNPNIPSTAVAADGAGGGGSSTLWANKTPAQIIRDINNLVNGVVTLTKRVHKPSRLAVSLDRYSYITSTPRSDNSDTTIAEYVIRNNPYLKEIVPCSRFSAAELAAGLGSANPFTGDIMIAYDPSPNMFVHRITQSVRQMPPQERNLELLINMLMRTAGVTVYYPFSMSIGENI